MNPEIKKQWVDALRSGDYKQGKNCLRFENRFCCLGVLCDIYTKTNVNKQWDHNYALMDTTKFLPQEVKTWAEFPNGITQHTLSRLNDEGISFLAIADKTELEL